MDTLIRTATLDDAESLCEFAAGVFWEAYQGMMGDQDLKDYIAEAFALPKIRGELQENHSCFFVAHEQNRLIGFCRVRVGCAPVKLPCTRSAEFVRVYLHSDFRNQGLGQNFFDVRKTWAQKRGCDGLWLSVWDKNQRGIQFHQKMGFKIVGEHDF